MDLFGDDNVPTLFEFCINVIQARLDSIKNLSKLNDDILCIILDKCTPIQIESVEARIGREIVAEEIWKKQCQSTTFVEPGFELEDGKTWRQLYREIMEIYNEKKKKTGESLRKMYNSADNNKKSKQIKIYDATPGIPKTVSSEVGYSFKKNNGKSTVSYRQTTTSNTSNNSKTTTTSFRNSSPTSTYKANTVAGSLTNQPKLMAKILKQSTSKKR